MKLRVLLRPEVVFWMWHQAEDRTCRICDARDIAGRAVRVVWITRLRPGVVRVPQCDTAACFYAHEGIGVARHEAALTVRDRAVNWFREALGEDARAERVGGQSHPAAFEMRVFVAGECSERLFGEHAVVGWQQAGFHESLEAIADAQNGLARCMERTQIVAETMGERDRPEFSGAKEPGGVLRITPFTSRRMRSQRSPKARAAIRITVGDGPMPNP